MKKGLEILRHSTSHVLAAAIKKLYPDVKLAIGPAIEDGFYYDFDNLKITEGDLKKIEKGMEEIIKADYKFKKIKTSKQKAKLLLKNEPYKLELLKEIKEPSFYQIGDFIDLCLGPHIESTGKIKAFKLLSLAGAYWRGDSKNKMLTRVYGVAFESKKELEEFLYLREQAEARNHIKLGKQLDLFSFHEEAPGFVFWHPKGIVLWDEIMRYWHEEHEKENYKEIRTPVILNRRLWEQSGHWDHYKESMYFTKIDNQDFAVKPMNCPGGILIYKERLHSYREFPIKMAEIGLVHRHELSGVLNGLFRVRSFFQDDAHIYCLPEQIEQEVIKIIKLTDRIYKIFKLKYHLELSTMPEKHIGSEEIWKEAECKLKTALKRANKSYKLNPGDGAFYGPKIDFHVEDALKRTWQTATIQLDFAMPQRFALTYEDESGKKSMPVMLHRTVFGSIERFIGILIENYAGNFPLWLAPIQARVLTLTERNEKFSEGIYEKLKESNIRVELDSRNESLSKKVLEAQSAKIPLIVTIGDKEEKNKTLAIRTLNGKIEFGVKIDKFIEEVKEKIERKD